MDIVVWLRSLGLGKYEAAFRENEIDETVLPNLTAEDLKDLGVGIVGHRRKLLDAIAALRNDGSVQTPPVKAALVQPSAEERTAAPAGERRHITVLFCDLVGSTSISAGLDAGPSQSCWRIILLRRVCPKQPSNGGAKRENGR